MIRKNSNMGLIQTLQPIWSTTKECVKMHIFPYLNKNIL